MAGASLICLGRIARPHGIKGECAADLQLEDAGILAKGQGLYLFNERRWAECRGRPDVLPEPHVLRGLREHKGRLLLTLEGTQDRDAAEALRGLLVCLPEEALPPPGEGEIYCYQLVGCSVFLPDGSRLGELVDVLTPTEEQEIWVVTTAQGREVLVPAHEETVVDVDIEARQVRIAPPEGLLEIYLGD